jgi:two-component system, OmpR family, response regulator
MIMDKTQFSILLVEDDPNLSAVLKDYLEMTGYSTIHCNDGDAGLDEFKKHHFDICILDVMMPKKDGFALADDIRKINEEVPIIFLTAKSLKDDRIRGFQHGCDDYITKPFSTEELSLRIKAILKRCSLRSNGEKRSLDGTYQLGRFTFDYVNMLLKSADGEKHLTRKESGVLKLLCEYQNQLLPRDVALKKVWGGSDYFIGRSMDVFIAKLRKMLSEDPRISISNVHGTGFKLTVHDSGESL